MTKTISGGGIPPGTDPGNYYDVYNDLSLGCLIGTDNSFEFAIDYQQIGFNATLTILNVSFSAKKANIYLGYRKFPIVVSTAEDAIFTVYHTDNWNSLDNPNLLFDLVVDYSISFNNTIDYGSDTYSFNLDICNIGYQTISSSNLQSRKKKDNIGNEVNKEHKSIISENILISPNPSKGEFQINYSLEEKATIDITIYNSIGQKVKTIIDSEQKEKGPHQINHSLSDDLDSGIYYISFRIGDEIRTERFVKL